MPDVPVADTCACGSARWHRITGSEAGIKNDRFFWCRRCGALRFVFDAHWQIPLDRAGDLPRSIALEDDERPTDPGTPAAKTRPKRPR